jgi:hypothetical protein
MRRLDNADCHIDCFLRFLVYQQLTDMSCGVTWVDEVIAWSNTTSYFETSTRQT